MEETENLEQNDGKIESVNESEEIDFDDEENAELSFADFGLDDEILQAIEKKGFVTPSPIQLLAIPRLLNGDANIIAKARTGTGKTAAFGLPIVQKTRSDNGKVRALILEPTRELAVQTAEELKSFTTSHFPRVAVLYGGASYREQIRDLKGGVEIVVGTPGRIIDHIERGSLSLSNIEYFILDEGDEMLDMGFIDDIEKIFGFSNPQARILLFSATMPKPILSIAQKFMGEYEVCEEEGFVEEPLLIEQKYWIVKSNDKIEALVRLIDSAPDFYGLVFTQTKSDADSVQKALDERGFESAALHGDIVQTQREKILARFRSGKTRILVATDVAARGIDITGLSHVVNYSLPFDGATYVHRIGRTGRAGTSGIAITFVRPDEKRRLEFLKASVRKAAKGELKFEPVPSVASVISAKKERFLSDLLSKIQNSERGGFEETAKKLLEDKDSVSVVASLLSAFYGKELSPSRYGDIFEIKNENPPLRTAKKGAKRLFVGLGKKDGFNAREIASFFSSVLKIPGRQVEDIHVADAYSLLSLPDAAAERVIEMSRRDSSFPKVHIDAKSGNSSNSAKKRDFSRQGKDGRFSKSRKEFKNEKSRPRVHTPTERNGASSYKKSKKK